MDYQAKIKEAQAQVAAALRDCDRQFWLNVLQAWKNLSVIPQADNGYAALRLTRFTRR